LFSSSFDLSEETLVVRSVGQRQLKEEQGASTFTLRLDSYAAVVRNDS
jgi:hypothetical protein